MSNEGAQGGGVVSGSVRLPYQPVRWVWPRWIPAGHVTVLIGPPRSGHCRLVAYLIAALTGAVDRWPDGAPVASEETGSVVLVDGDEARHDYGLWLYQLGVRRERLWSAARDPLHLPTLTQDVEHVATLARAKGAVAIVADGLCGREQAPELGAMQEALAAAWRLALGLDLPVIAVHRTQGHSLPRAEYRLDQVRGDYVIHRYARAVLALYPSAYGAAAVRGAAGAYRLEALKRWFGPCPAPLRCVVDEEGIAFGPAPIAPSATSALDMAATFLLEALADGPVPIAALLAAGAEAGHARRTLYRARHHLGLRTVRRQWWLSGHGEPP